MQNTIRLGRIRGVSVGVHWSLLVVAALVSWSLASGQLPAAVPGSSSGAYWLAGILAAGLFFVSILAHEMSHAVVAQRVGMRVEGITLWLLGGVSKLEGKVPSARAELAIAVSGPAVSVALGLVFAGLTIASVALGLHGLVVAVFGWLAFINLLLGLFNLLPAAPLDGGRVLTGLLWLRHGDEWRANATSAKAGRVFGTIVCGVGIFELLGGSPAGIWTLLLGLFVLYAARGELGVAEVHRRVGDVLVRDVMTADPVVATGWQNVAYFSDIARASGHRAFPVAAWEGGIAGVVTLDRLATVPPENRTLARVLDVTVPLSGLRTARPDDKLVDVLTAPKAVLDPRILVFDDDGHLVGLITPTDLSRVAADPGAATRTPAPA
ncbi:MAG: site-2 protease family protein [Actinomycetia bacterium]|nr:site-2 protease family protein [Actinomycetes bacterium]